MSKEAIDDGVPSREVITDDCHPCLYPAGKGSAAWIASTNTIMDLIRRQHASECRLHLGLREVVDLKDFPTEIHSGSRTTTWVRTSSRPKSRS